MEAKKSLIIRKISFITAIATAAIAPTAFLANSASAASFTSMVPQFETEINVGLGCLDNTKCLSNLTSYGIQSIESLIDTKSGTKSRLFVDNLATKTTYNGGALGTAIFKAGDSGTNPLGFWLRPSETNANGSVGEEKGQLEVGTYKFTFTDKIPLLKIAYFDTESKNSTGVPDADLAFPLTSLLQTDGTLFEGDNPIPKGTNGNIKYQVWQDVSYITLKLGNDTVSGSGDGVDFQLEKTAVPEPASTLGLGALAAMSIFGLRKRHQHIE